MFSNFRFSLRLLTAHRRLNLTEGRLSGIFIADDLLSYLESLWYIVV